MRTPQGDGIAEWLMGPLKEQLLWIHECHELGEMNAPLQQWRHRYNEHWLVEHQGYCSAAQVRYEYCGPACAAG